MKMSDALRGAAETAPVDVGSRVCGRRAVAVAAQSRAADGCQRRCRRWRCGAGLRRRHGRGRQPDGLALPRTDRRLRQGHRADEGAPIQTLAMPGFLRCPGPRTHAAPPLTRPRSTWMPRPRPSPSTLSTTTPSTSRSTPPVRVDAEYATGQPTIYVLWNDIIVGAAPISWRLGHGPPLPARRPSTPHTPPLVNCWDGAALARRRLHASFPRKTSPLQPPRRP